MPGHADDPQAPAAGPTRPAADRLAIAAALHEIAARLTIEGGNAFRARAYDRAARALEDLTGDFDALLAAGRLTEVRNIGSGVERVILDLAASGRSGLLDRLRQQFPPALVELRQVLSAPQARLVAERLGLGTLEALRDAAVAGRLAGLRGFGPRTVERLVARIDQRRAAPPRILLPEALRDGESLAAHLRGSRAAATVEPAGALRRRVEATAELALVVATDDPGAIAERARVYPRALAVDAVDAERLRIRHAGGLDALLHVTTPASFPAALLDATGAPEHVAALRARAAARGLTLDARGLTRAGAPVPIADEAAIYAQLGLAWVPPELRENAGEIHAAADGTLPTDLVRLEDLRGVVHCHTTESDGADTLEDMARAAEALGLQYLTVTDHSVTASYAGGLDRDRLRRQRDEVARVQARVGIRLLHGTESDILRDGALDYPDAVLAELDVIIASIHNRYRLDPEQMTQRVVRAIRHPLFKIWGHALGRYVLSRPPIACDVEAILDAVAGSRAAIEVNGDPHRLDLAPEWIRAARRRDIRFVISADAHSVHAIRNLRWGVDMARRGWVRRGEVLNTMGADEFAAAVRP